MRCHFKSILTTLAFAASLHTTSVAAANTTILVGTEDNIDELVYAITFNGKDEIDFLSQTNVSNEAPSWLALHPTDKTKLLVVYEGSNKYQNFKIGQGGQLTAEFTAQDAGVGPPFGVFSNDGQFMVFADFTDGGFVVARYFANGTSFPITQDDNPDDPNRFLGPNPSSPTHPHEFVEHPKLNVGYIPNLGANLTSFYQFNDGKLTFQSALKVDGGPRHMVINKAGTLGWIVTETSCQIQPVKFDETGNLTSNGDPVAITQGNQTVGAGGEILLSQDERMIIASNRQVNGSQNDFLTTFEVDSDGQLTNPATYDTKGQVVRGLAFNNDTTLLVFGHQTNGTVGMFGRDAGTNKLTLLTPNLLNLTAAAKIQSPAAPSSFVFLD
ncbi:Lactonase, 7-bladed beta-propeller domain containing protein [Russula decolorans]|jgi:6-phosphogluconolactonase (cycloisomerase 2 family)